MTTDEIKEETVNWLSDKGNSEQVSFQTSWHLFTRHITGCLEVMRSSYLKVPVVMMQYIHGAILL